VAGGCVTTAGAGRSTTTGAGVGAGFSTTVSSLRKPQLPTRMHSKMPIGNFLIRISRLATSARCVGNNQMKVIGPFREVGPGELVMTC